MGYTHFQVIWLINKQIQFFKIFIQTTKSQSMVIKMAWVTKGTKTIGIFKLFCIVNGKQTDWILPNDDPTHQITEYNN